MSSSAQSPIREPSALEAARDAAVVCDLAPLSLLAIDGPDAATFLNGQLSNDAARLDGSVCQYTSYNSPAGRVLANLLLWRAGIDPGAGFRALIAADIADAIRRRLTMFVLRSKVTIADVAASIARIGVGGPRANAAIRAVLNVSPREFSVERSGDTVVLGLPGARFIVLTPVEQSSAMMSSLEHHARRADYEVWRWLTIRSGVPVITAATQDKFVPQMINLDALGAIDFRKGCYTGQEIIARTQYLGRLKERLYAFASPSAAATPGDRLFSPLFGDQPCGTVVNSAPAPSGGCELLSVLQIAAAGGDVRLRAPDGPLLTPLPLPYELPAATTPRGRLA